MKRILVCMLIAFTVLGLLVGCSSNNNQEDQNENLTQELSFQGVTLRYPDDWKTPDYNGNVFRMVDLPTNKSFNASQGFIKVSAYTKGEAKELNTVTAIANNGIRKDVSYSIDKAWQSTGIRYTLYSGTYDAAGTKHNQKILLGNQISGDKGFVVTSELTMKGASSSQLDEYSQMIDKVLSSVKYDPDKTTVDSADAYQQNLKSNSSGKSSSSSSSISSSSSTTPKPTTGQSNALSKAKSYLSFMAFSQSGLIEQLEYDGFTPDEATYAVDNCGANWNEQAAKKAQSYLDIMAFSRSGLIDQLEYDGFTAEQAEYGVSQVYQ